MAVLCPGDGGMNPCPYGMPVRFVVKLSTVRGWRGRFCMMCLTSWLAFQKSSFEKGDKVSIETLW